MATHEDQMRLLEALGRMGSAGRAEGEDRIRLPRTFWPVPEHLRAFDPDVVLVVGPRGAGKTELFRAVIEHGLLSKLAARAPGVRLPPLERTHWLAAYPIGAEFPSERLLREFIRGKSATDELFLDVWLAYLVRVLRDELPEDSLRSVFQPQGGDVEAVLGAFQANAKEALLALDRLDRRLTTEDRHVIVAYDELDLLARGDAELTRAAVRGLVALWASHSRRWQRLRGKIFLRTDLYDRAAVAGGADFAKLAANRAELAWSDRHLYAMLVRRLTNAGDEELGRYCEAKIKMEDDQELGRFPVIRKAEDARPLIERMVGIYMGANERKGLTHRWLLDHIRDGRGQALPRPLVRLFESAADVQRGGGSLPRWPRLLEPRALRRALDKVSGDHVGDALHEWPWLVGLKERLARLREVPWERREIDRHLDGSFGDPWGKGGDLLPPAASGRELVEYLVEVGIFRARADGRIDAPDLFLSGLGLRRKGGVRRR